MPKTSMTINQFDGGLNTKYDPSDLDLNESPDCQNMVYTDVGAVETRNGYSAFTSAPLNTGSRIDGLYTLVEADRTSTLIGFCGGTAWRMSGNTGVTISSSQNTLQDGQNVFAAQAQNKLFISNGINNPMKYDGTAWTRWGVSAPSAPTAAINSNGTLTGAYRYVCVGKNSHLVQGDYGSASTEVSLTGNDVAITDIPSYPISAGVNEVLICRNTAAASGVYYIVTAVTNGVSAITDNVSDDQLSADDLAPLDNGLPAKFTSHVWHTGRMFGAASESDNPQYLYYSFINEPEIFPAENIIKVGEGDGYPITGLAVLSNSILIAKTDSYGQGSVYLLYMPSASAVDWSLSKLDTANSSQAAKAMINFSNWVMLLNADGIFDINENSIGEIKTDGISYKIEPDVLSFAAESIGNAVAVNYKNKVWVSVPKN